MIPILFLWIHFFTEKKLNKTNVLIFNILAILSFDILCYADLVFSIII